MIGYRIAAPAAALMIFITFSALHAFGRFDTYHQLLYWGIKPFIPFIDTSGALAAWQCTRLGLDVVEHDPCDVLGRAYSYSPLWMAAAAIPLGITSTAKVGWTLGFVFLVSLVLLPPPKRPWELALVVLATISTMVVFAVERGNPDLIVFMLTMLVGFVALRAPPRRLLAYPIALFAALFLKYYPITLMILTFRERISLFFAINLTALSIVLLFVLAYFSDLERGIPLIAVGPYYTDLFSAKNLPFGIALKLGHAAAGSQLSALHIRLIADAVYALMLMTGARICWRVLKGGKLRTALNKLTPQEMIFLVIGSVLIVGCFFAAQSIGYRGIFLLFVIPGLLAIARNGNDRTVRALGAGTAAVTVFIMWGECIRQNLMLAYGLSDAFGGDFPILVFWLLRELAWWWVISILTAVLLEFIWESPVVRTALSLVPGRGGQGGQIGSNARSATDEPHTLSGLRCRPRSVDRNHGG